MTRTEYEEFLRAHGLFERGAEGKGAIWSKNRFDGTPSKSYRLLVSAQLAKDQYYDGGGRKWRDQGTTRFRDYDIVNGQLVKKAPK